MTFVSTISEFLLADLCRHWLQCSTDMAQHLLRCRYSATLEMLKNTVILYQLRIAYNFAFCKLENLLILFRFCYIVYVAKIKIHH